MSRLDFMFYEDGQGSLAWGEDLAEDRKEAGKHEDDGNIVVHVHVELPGRIHSAVVDTIAATYELEVETTTGESTTLEKIVTAIFRAGVVHGRKLAIKAE